MLVEVPAHVVLVIRDDDLTPDSKIKNYVNHEVPTLGNQRRGLESSALLLLFFFCSAWQVGEK